MPAHGAIGDLPLMAASAYASTTHNLSHAVGRGFTPTQSSVVTMGDVFKAKYGQQTDHTQVMELIQVAQQARRVIKVIIADTNENVPLEDCVLFSGEEKLTDLTDQELFFELDIRGLLEKHNAKRVKLVDKKVKDRTEHLEPAKVRDLKMVVVTVAQF